MGCRCLGDASLGGARHAQCLPCLAGGQRCTGAVIDRGGRSRGPTTGGDGGVDRRRPDGRARAARLARAVVADHSVEGASDATRRPWSVVGSGRWRPSRLPWSDRGEPFHVKHADGPCAPGSRSRVDTERRASRELVGCGLVPGRLERRTGGTDSRGRGHEPIVTTGSAAVWPVAVRQCWRSTSPSVGQWPVVCRLT